MPQSPLTSGTLLAGLSSLASFTIDLVVFYLYFLLNVIQTNLSFFSSVGQKVCKDQKKFFRFYALLEWRFKFFRDLKRSSRNTYESFLLILPTSYVTYILCRHHQFLLSHQRTHLTHPHPNTNGALELAHISWWEPIFNLSGIFPAGQHWGGSLKSTMWE